MITRRAVMVGAAAVAAAIVVPTAAKGLTIAGPNNPLPAGWIHCDWRVEIAESEYPDLYRVLLDAAFPWGVEDLPDRIALPRFPHYDPWEGWNDILIIKARYGDDGIDSHWMIPVGKILGWRVRGP